MKDVTPETFPYTLRQPPGADNALGRVKFLFPNPHSIYLHDTPSQELFEAERRMFSSGCIRVERPLELAERLLKGQNWSGEKIRRVVDSGETISQAGASVRSGSSTGGERGASGEVATAGRLRTRRQLRAALAGHRATGSISRSSAGGSTTTRTTTLIHEGGRCR